MEGRAKTLKRGAAFIHCLYNIYARRIYVRTQVKLTRQWKSTLITLSVFPRWPTQTFGYCAVRSLL